MLYRSNMKWLSEKSMPSIQTYDWIKTGDSPIFNLCNATSAAPMNEMESVMNADSRDFKFTDGIEREMIKQEIATESANGMVNSMTPLLKWILAVALAVGSMFVIASNGL